MTIKNISHTEACPISLDQVDKHLIKLYSTTVLIILLSSLIFSNKISIYFITIDFFIRVFIGIKYSPLCIVLTKFLKVTAIKPLLVDSGRKKIAAQVGLLFGVLISLGYVFNYPVFSLIITLMFISAIFLDLIFDYCLACKLQSLFYKYIKK